MLSAVALKRKRKLTDQKKAGNGADALKAEVNNSVQMKFFTIDRVVCIIMKLHDSIMIM